MGRWISRHHGPSDAARHRLLDAIRSNRAELEVQVAEGLMRSELYLRSGHPDAAAEVLEEQRARVALFEGDVRHALAAAAAEAEAEAVLATTAGVAVLHDRPQFADRLPNLVAAAVAAVASLAVMTAVGVGADGEGALASTSIGATDDLAVIGIDVSGPLAPDALRFRHYGTGLVADNFPETAVPEESEARAWLAEHDSMLERLGVRARVRTQVLRELKGLVATLVPGTPMTGQMWMQVLTNAVAAAEQRESAKDQATVSEPPAEEGPAAESSEGGHDDERRSWLSRRPAAEDEGEASGQEASGQEAEHPEAPSAPQPPADGEPDADGSEGSSPEAPSPSDATGSDGQFRA